MKHALMAQIEVSLPAKAGELLSAITARVVGKALWQGQENRVTRGKSESGSPVVSVELRFDKLAERDGLVQYLKSLDDRPNVEVIIETHDCYHDIGGKPCLNWKGI